MVFGVDNYNRVVIFHVIMDIYIYIYFVRIDVGKTCSCCDHMARTRNSFF